MASVLAAASPDPRARFATVSSRDGQFRASVPLEALATGHLRDGRLVVPDAPTRCWNVKDVNSIVVTMDKASDSVEARRRRAPAAERGG